MERDDEDQELLEEDSAEPSTSGVRSSPGSEPAGAPEAERIDEDETLSNRSRVLRFAKRMLDRKELAEDSKLLISAVLSTSDKAKTEAVRLMAREFRAYLKELRLKEDLLDLARSHSLEISVHLKPLPPRRGEPEPEE